MTLACTYCSSWLAHRHVTCQQCCPETSTYSCGPRLGRRRQTGARISQSMNKCTMIAACAAAVAVTARIWLYMHSAIQLQVDVMCVTVEGFCALVCMHCAESSQ
jgi:hypothetical protein